MSKRHDTEKAMLIGHAMDAEERIATLEAQLAEARATVERQAAEIAELREKAAAWDRIVNTAVNESRRFVPRQALEDNNG